jgi:hypothetical protein
VFAWWLVSFRGFWVVFCSHFLMLKTRMQYVVLFLS